MSYWLKRRPWIFIILFFLSYVTAWMGLIRIALQNQPAPFPAAAPAPSALHES